MDIPQHLRHNPTQLVDRIGNRIPVVRIGATDTLRHERYFDIPVSVGCHWNRYFADNRQLERIRRKRTGQTDRRYCDVADCRIYRRLYLVIQEKNKTDGTIFSMVNIMG